MRRVGVVTATALEAAALRGRRGRQAREATSASTACEVRVATRGPGAARAREAAEELLAAGATALVSLGFAAGLDPALAAGAVLAPEEVGGAAGEGFATDAAWRARLAEAAGAALAASGGRLATAAEVLATPAAKEALRATTGALAADQESAAVAAAARAAGVPFLCLRAVSDAAGDALPPAALAALRADGRVAPLAVLARLARRPGEARELARLARGAALALAGLRRVARRAGPALAHAAPIGTPG